MESYMTMSKTSFYIFLACVALFCGSSGEHGGSSESGLNADCLLPKEVGPCRAAMPRFYYNKEKKACEQFIYGGCSGNNNNFRTKEECDRTCRHP